MPIEKLEAPRVHGQYCTCDATATRAKINEIREVVNGIQDRLSAEPAWHYSYDELASPGILAPESVQQDKEATLYDAIDGYAEAIRHQERTPSDGPALLRVAEAYDAIISAAQREYSQKEEKE